MDIEKLATAAVEESISLTDVLSPFINNGDKEPSWDGNIYIHEDKSKHKKGIKKVPVQVKGEQRKRVPPKKIPKFSVTFTDLDNWLIDGGVLLFVVLIDDTGCKKAIYYSSLLPVMIRHLKKVARGKKTLSVPLREFPTDNNRKVAVLLDFYNHMQKQTSFANAPLYTIEQLEKEGVLENVSMTVTTYAKPDDTIDVESLFFENDVYIYAHIKGSSVLQPLPDVPRDIHIGRDVIADIKVKDQVYYNKYHVVRYAEGFNIHIGRSIVFMFDPDTKKGSLSFKNRGTLADYIYDTECIIAIIENREITINGVVFPFDDLGKTNVESYKENLQYYRDIKKMLDKLGVHGELECDNLSDEDQNNIRNFTNAMVYGKNIGFSGADTDSIYGRFKLANLIILIWADRDKKSEKGFILQSYFSDQKIALFERDDREKRDPHQITHYALLRKNDFIDAVNIDYDKIVDDLSNNDKSKIVLENILLFMLEMLKAYDEMKNKNDKLLSTAQKYCEWLEMNASDCQEIMILNRLQIIKRIRELDETEIHILHELRKNTTELPVRCGANILLGKIESAQDCFDEMSEAEKQEFVEYPICHFGKMHYERKGIQS